MINLNKASLRAKTVFLFGFILIGIFYQIYLSFNSLNHLKHQYNTVSETHFENIILLEQLDAKINKNLVLSEKYIGSHDHKDKQSQEEDYLKLETAIQALEKKIAQELTPSFDLVKTNIGAYKDSFAAITKLVIEQGSPNKGIIGDLNSGAKSIEDFINNSGLGEYYTQKLFEFRQREKDFLISGDIKFFNQLKIDTNELNERMNSKNLDDSRKSALTNLIKKYESHFDLLTKNFSKLKEQKNIFYQNTDNIDSEISHIISKSKLSLTAVKDNINKSTKSKFMIFGIVSGIIVFLVGVINFFAYRFTQSLSNDVSSLKSISEDFVSSCDKISTSSDHLNKIATEQSSSIQETASSIKEISAMVSKNSEATSQTQELTDKNSIAAQNGMNTIIEVLKAMDKLSDSSSSITSRFHKTSEELQGVVSIINQIGDKAKVINDIVFQTKLLSFNASVEAARAGEHGKGFSVVAEEIGNLAAMSGTSAEEITKILDASIKKVTGIVTGNQKDISSLVSENDTNLNYGKTTVRECENSLKEIISNITHVSNAINEIATASKEQDSGVKEISQAIATLSSTNQETVKHIQNSAGYTQSIEENTHQVFNMASHLEKILLGEKKAKKSNHGTVEFFDSPATDDDKAA